MRKTLTVNIGPEGGRDEGKVFIITEPSAMKAESWARRGIIALLKAGIEVPDDVANAGLAGIASLGVQGLAKAGSSEIDALYDELLNCVQIRPSPNVVRNVIPDDFEEMRTLIRLRVEVFQLMTGFSLPASLLARLSGSTLPEDAANTSNTSTSPASSAA